MEDEGASSQEIAETLRSLGYRTAPPAKSGEEALVTAASDPPSLALVDLALAGSLDGIATATRLREELDVPTVFLTGPIDDRDVESEVGRARTAEPQGYLARPFTVRQLKAAIEIALKNHELEKIFSRATDSGEQVQRLVAEVERFASAQSAGVALLDLPSVLDAAAQKVEASSSFPLRARREYGVTPFVAANRGELVEVFVSLLGLAPAAPTGDASPWDKIRVTTSSDDDGRAVIEVRDRGTADLASPAFDLARRALATMKGELTVDSTTDGFRVRVVLPAARASDPKVSLRRGRILIVDDDAAVARSAARALARDHHVVVENDSARARDRLLSGEHFDAILCDLAMPDISGAELYEIVAAASPDVASRFVFVTGGAFTNESRTFLGRVTNVALEKPFSIERLRKTLEPFMLKAV
ncbi:MAG TPA: response regulator [Polyangiaceae bacterium]